MHRRTKMKIVIYKKDGKNFIFICRKKTSVRMYTKEELEEIAKKVGFKIVNFFDGFSFNSVRPSSRRILAIFRV